MAWEKKSSCGSLKLNFIPFFPHRLFFALPGMVYEQPQHAVLKKWIMLTNPKDRVNGATGFVKVRAAGRFAQWQACSTLL